MSNTRLFIEGQEVDLGEAVVALTKQADSFLNPESVQADYSNTIQLPDTQKNRAILGFADEVGSETDVPYKVLDAQLYKDGVEVVPYGKGEMQNGSFEMDIYSGNRNFFDVLGDKSIQELDLSAFNHSWAYANIVANSANNIWQQGFVYDLYDRGKNLSLSAVDCFYLYPSVFARAIWEQIFMDAGFTYTEFSNPMFDKFLIPVAELYTFPDNYRKAREFRVTSNAPDVHREKLATEKVKFNFIRDGFGVDSNGGYQLNNWQYVVDTPRVMTFSTGVKVRINSSSGGVEAILTIRVNGGVIAETKFDNTDVIDPLDPNSNLSRFMTIETGPTTLKAGDVVEVFVRLKEATDFAVADPDFWVYHMADGADRPFFSGTVLPDFPKLGEVELNKWLPDISQKDFVLSMHSLFGMSFQTELYQDSIQISQFHKVVDNIPQAIDMSARVHAPEQVRPLFKFGDFAQKNHVLWKPDETVIDGFNNGFILVNNGTLPTEKDLIKLPFAATEGSRFAGLLSIPMWRAKADSNPVEYEKVKAQPRLVIQGSDTVSFTIVELANNGSIVNESTAARPVAYYIDPLKPFDLRLQEYIIPTFYSTLLGILDKTKVLPVQMRLSAEFIQNWRPEIPIWIDYWQQYFYVNKIEEYIDEASLTEVELIRL